GWPTRCENWAAIWRLLDESAASQRVTWRPACSSVATRCGGWNEAIQPSPLAPWQPRHSSSICTTAWRILPRPEATKVDAVWSNDGCHNAFAVPAHEFGSSH